MINDFCILIMYAMDKQAFLVKKINIIKNNNDKIVCVCFFSKIRKDNATLCFSGKLPFIALYFIKIAIRYSFSVFLFLKILLIVCIFYSPIVLYLSI